MANVEPTHVLWSRNFAFVVDSGGGGVERQADVAFNSSDRRFASRGWQY